jgi:hypothetical protein
MNTTMLHRPRPQTVRRSAISTFKDEPGWRAATSPRDVAAAEILKIHFSEKRVDSERTNFDHRPLNFVTSVAIFGSRIRFLP